MFHISLRRLAIDNMAATKFRAYIGEIAGIPLDWNVAVSPVASVGPGTVDALPAPGETPCLGVANHTYEMAVGGTRAGSNFPYGWRWGMAITAFGNAPARGRPGGEVDYWKTVLINRALLEYEPLIGPGGELAGAPFFTIPADAVEEVSVDYGTATGMNISNHYPYFEAGAPVMVEIIEENGLGSTLATERISLDYRTFYFHAPAAASEELYAMRDACMMSPSQKCSELDILVRQLTGGNSGVDCSIVGEVEGIAGGLL